MPLIKRYPNRKLYDTEAKRYVTLDDITAMVRAEKEVRVMDNDTGEDVTSLTLTQIILEQEKKSSGYLPSALLTNLIRTGGATIDQLRKSVHSGVAGVAGMGGLTEATRRRSQELEAQVSNLYEQGKLNLEQGAIPHPPGGSRASQESSFGPVGGVFAKWLPPPPSIVSTQCCGAPRASSRGLTADSRLLRSPAGGRMGD